MGRTQTQQARQAERLSANVRQAQKNKKDLKSADKNSPKKQSGGKLSFLSRIFGTNKPPQTAQQSIPYRAMYKDGICRVNDKLYTKTIAFDDINYQLAQNEDKTQIFENYCDFLN